MKILLCGIQKTGNTWVRFVIFNYFNILNNGATETLTFDELRVIHDLRRIKGKGRSVQLSFKHKDDGFPDVYHTHWGYNGTGFAKRVSWASFVFDRFDKLIYIYRNPFDTMISYHRFLFNRDKIPYHSIGLYKMHKLEDFTKYYLSRFIKHVKETMHRADVVLDYDRLRKDPSGFIEAIKLVDGTIDMKVFKKAIEMSSFDNIKKMSIETEQPYGVGGPLYKGFFCRDGRTGQYREIMSEELKLYIKKECQKAKLNIWGEKSWT